MKPKGAKQNSEPTPVESAQEDVKLYGAFAAFAESEAGGIIFETYSKDIASTIHQIVAGYKTMPDTDLRALAAKLEARITFLQSLSRARTNKEDAEAYLAELIV